MMWTKEQTKAHRKLWVEALRSGNYAQTRGSLKSANGFCCLGVACNVYLETEAPAINDKWVADESGAWFFYHTEGRNNGVLPDVVRDWLGLRRNNGRFIDPYSQYGYSPATSLISKNDIGNENFATIADIIESEPEGLVVE